MLLEDTEVVTRLESPLNLLNRLKSETASRHNPITIPCLPDQKKITSSDLIDDIDSKLAIGSSKSNAISVMNKALSKLDKEIDAIDVKKLPAVIKDMSITLKNLEPEKEDKNLVQFIVYKPEVFTEDHFEVVQAND